MTGSTLSLYLEETKTCEEAIFHSDISTIKREAIHSEVKNKSSLSMLTRAREVSSGTKRDPPEIVSPTALALHKVVLNTTHSYILETDAACKAQKVYASRLTLINFLTRKATLIEVREFFIYK